MDKTAQEVASDRVFVVIGGQSIDFTEVPPINGADRKALKKQGIKVIGASVFADLDEDPEKESLLLVHLVKKLKPDVTLEEVDALPTGVRTGILLHFIKTSNQGANNPFLSLLTSSPASTAGPKKT